MSIIPNGLAKADGFSRQDQGNHPLKKGIINSIALITGLFLFSFFANAQPSGISALRAEGYFTCWGEIRPVELFWSINEDDPKICEIQVFETLTITIPFSGTDFRESILKVARKYGEWIEVAKDNGVTETFQKIPVELGISAESIIDTKRNWKFANEDDGIPCIGAFFKVKGDKMLCQINFRVNKEDLFQGTMNENSHVYGMQFESPNEVKSFADCLDLSFIDRFRWSDTASGPDQLEKAQKQLFK